MRWVSRLAALIFPWPARDERRARVESARLAAEEAQLRAAHTQPLMEELRALREHNHVTEALNQMISRRAREQ